MAVSKQALVVTNDDGSKQITIEGTRYLGLTRKQVDDWQKLINDHNASLAVIDTLKQQIAALNDQVSSQTSLLQLKDKEIELISFQRDSYKTDFTRSQDDAKRNYNLFLGEHQLRVDAQQFVPHKQSSGFAGAVFKFLDSGYGQGLFKVGLPLAQTVLTSNRCSR